MKSFLMAAMFVMICSPNALFAKDPETGDSATFNSSSCHEFYFHGSASRNSDNGMSIVTARCPDHMPKYIGHSWYGTFTADDGYCEDWPTPKATTERETALYRYRNGMAEQNGIFIRRNSLREETRLFCWDRHGNQQPPDWWRVHARLMCCGE